MALTLKDIDLKADLPDLPPTLPVFEVSAPTLEERRPGLERLRDHFQLGDLRSIQLDHALIMAGERGEIEYFYASGGVWARDATATRGDTNELRRWSDIQESENGEERRFTLGPETTRRLISQARELLQGAGLIGREIASETVDLDQVAHLTAKGKERERGAGQATVKFTYAVEGLPVRGAGAKTLMFAEPENGSVRFTGAFHAWRVLGTPRPSDVSDRQGARGRASGRSRARRISGGGSQDRDHPARRHIPGSARVHASEPFVPGFPGGRSRIGREEGARLPLCPLPPRRTARCVCGSRRVPARISA